MFIFFKILFSISEEKCKNWWYYLRRRYRKHLLQNHLGIPVQYKFANELEFMRQYISFGKLSSTVIQESSPPPLKVLTPDDVNILSIDPPEFNDEEFDLSSVNFPSFEDLNLSPPTKDFFLPQVSSTTQDLSEISSTFTEEEHHLLSVLSTSSVDIIDEEMDLSWFPTNTGLDFPSFEIHYMSQ